MKSSKQFHAVTLVRNGGETTVHVRRPTPYWPNYIATWKDRGNWVTGTASIEEVHAAFERQVLDG